MDTPEAPRPGEVAGAFGPIALGLSGGGYRAAAYHLGALSVLDHLGLLGDVTALSTVSGGTITGARWAWGLARGESFATVYRALRSFLETTDCVQEAIAGVGSKRDTPSGRISLITAAANVYASRLVAGATFGDLVDRCEQLTEVSFNTTEFQSGLSFRFLKSASRLASIGNAKYWLEPAAARQLRLGDIVAASSCFPGGFEPMGFPEDFVWPGGAPPAGASTSPNALGRIPRGLALMDGGIYDNQGVEALIQAQARARRKGAGFGLVVISDVDQNPELFTPRSPEPAAAEADAALFRLTPQAPGWLSFPLLRLGVWTGGILAALSAGVLVVDQATSGWPRGLDYVRRVFPAVVMVLVALAAPLAEWWLRSKVRGQLSAKAALLWAFLREQKLAIGKDLLMLRGRSLFALTSRVFMKRIRTLVQLRLLSGVFEKGRVLSNEIADLLGAAPAWTLDGRYAELTPPSSTQLTCARAAHELDTTLWFEHRAQLDDVVATGQGTLCLNLLLHVRERRKEAPDEPRLALLEQRLLGLWARLTADPRALLELQGREPQKA